MDYSAGLDANISAPSSVRFLFLLRFGSRKRLASDDGYKWLVVLHCLLLLLQGGKLANWQTGNQATID